MAVHGLPVLRLEHEVFQSAHLVEDIAALEEGLGLLDLDILVGHLLPHQVDNLQCFVRVEQQEIRGASGEECFVGLNQKLEVDL